MSYPVLDLVSKAYPRVQGRLPTCYSPVRHSSTPERASAFDLHVLSTPPAFVLSQDQTLQQGQKNPKQNSKNRNPKKGNPKSQALKRRHAVEFSKNTPEPTGKPAPQNFIASRRCVKTTLTGPQPHRSPGGHPPATRQQNPECHQPPHAQRTKTTTQHIIKTIANARPEPSPFRADREKTTPRHETPSRHPQEITERAGQQGLTRRRTNGLLALSPRPPSGDHRRDLADGDLARVAWQLDLEERG